MTSKKNDHGLLKQIKYVEETIALKEANGKDATYEKDLVKAWRTYLPKGSNIYLGLAYSRAGSHAKGASHEPVVKI